MFPDKKTIDTEPGKPMPTVDQGFSEWLAVHHDTRGTSLTRGSRNMYALDQAGFVFILLLEEGNR